MRATAQIVGHSARVSGYIAFEQPDDDALADVTVRLTANNLAPGSHGLHVHQYGDVRVTTSLATLGAHFVPQCAYRRDRRQLQELPDTNISDGNDCRLDQLHGLPPSAQRQPGDMGNITVNATGGVETSFVLGQRKLSLSDGLRSIVGRAVVIHSLPDDGSQPFGNAGPPHAFGVIGIASPAAGAANGARAPNVPPVDKVICDFQPAAAGRPRTINGTVLLTLQVPYRPSVVKMQARLQGVDRSSEHSFHFHEWGDPAAVPSLPAMAPQLGAIYHSNAIEVGSIRVDERGLALYEHEFAADSLEEHVGRALTIHAGPGSDSPTVAVAVCGIANPSAVVDTSSLALDGGAAGLSALASSVSPLALGLLFSAGGLLLVACGLVLLVECRRRKGVVVARRVGGGRARAWSALTREVPLPQFPTPTRL